ncbi:MAG: protein kinase [Acidobacteriota bacterium]
MKDLLREAKKAGRKKDFSRAGDLCDMAGHPLDAITYYVKGKHFLLAGQVAARIGEYAQAAGFFNKAGDAGQAAEMYIKAGQKKKAAATFEQSGQYVKAAELEEQMQNYMAAAAFYELGGRTEKAADLFARAGDNARAAELYERMMQPDGSAAIDSGAYALDHAGPRKAKYARFAGILHMKAGRFDKAGKLLQQAGLFDQAVEAYRKAGRTERATALLMRLENYEEALRLIEDNPSARIDPKMLGELYLRSGRFDRAAQEFLANGLKFKAAECFESAGNLVRAADLFLREGEIIRAADLYQGAGRHQEAARAYEEAAEWENAAHAYEKASLPREAARAHLKAGRVARAARIYMDAGEKDEAIRILQKVGSGEPAFGQSSFLLGTLFFERGLFAPAATKFEAAVQILANEDRVRGLYHLALTYEQMGRAQEACGLYEQILAVDFHHADVADRLKALAAQVGPPAPETTTTPSGVGTTSQQMLNATPQATAGSITGRLEGTRLLGQGPHATVMEAYDRILQKKVAAKKYPPRQTDGPDMIDRFLREARKVSDLSHPHLVGVFGVGEDHEGRYIIEELVEGRTLREILDEKIRLEPARIIDYSTQICDLLAYAHRQGILHRNLRPSNIFIRGDDQVKVSDFGLSRRISDPAASRDLTLCYRSPESIRSERVDRRSDIYAFGIILFEMLIGAPPFPLETAAFDHVNVPPAFPSKVDRVIPAFLRKIVKKCLAKDQARRYRSAEQILDELKASALVPGAVIADRYEIVRELGIGGMGRIYQAIDRDLDEVVALKVLRAGTGEDNYEERFLREIKMTRKITHPNVVKVFDLGSWRDHKYITMEYIDGMNIEQWVRLRPRLDIPEAIRLIIGIAQGLSSAHALGIIHRDIKPQNILLKSGTVPKVLDFGIARTSGNRDMTTAGFVMGSPKYMSPEQVQGQPLDARTDIYSLGVVMYFVFTGREPFVGDSSSVIAYKHLGELPRAPRDVNPEVPDWLSDLILRALAKNSDDRFATMEELIEALRDHQSEAVATAGSDA